MKGRRRLGERVGGEEHEEPERRSRVRRGVDGARMSWRRREVSKLQDSRRGEGEAAGCHASELTSEWCVAEREREGEEEENWRLSVR